MRKKDLSAWLLWIVLVLPTAAHAQTLDDLVSEAWRAHGSPAALDARIDAQRHATRRAGGWMNPVFAVEYSNVPVDSLALDESPMSGVQFKLTQPFPFPGKADKRRAGSEYLTAAAQWERAEKVNQLRFAVTKHYYELARNRLLQQITERHLEQAATLVAMVRIKFQVGATGQHNLLRLAVLEERLRDDLAEFARGEVEHRAMLNALLARDPGTPIQTPGLLEPVAPAAADLWEQARDARPLLNFWTEKARAEQAEAERAGYEAWPDPSLWVGYRVREEIVGPDGMVRDEGDDFLTFGIAFSLPLLHGQGWGAAKKEKLARAQAAQHERRAVADDLRGQLATALASWRRAYEKAQVYRNKIGPDQNRALESTRSAYRVGSADFATLYGTEVGLLDIERQAVTAVVETHLRQAQVEALVGADLPDAGVKK
ncbi:MAG: TolC family protein [Candidatus Lernaella stagnicola]|nr:TolC family protein [Candidatus Lernaella stagnicola]